MSKKKPIDEDKAGTAANGENAIQKAQAEYDRIAAEAVAFDPATIAMEREWKKEITDKRNARKADRLILLKQKREAFEALQAARALAPAEELP